MTAMEDHTLERAVVEPRGAFGGFIGPQTLVGLVKIAQPFLWKSDREVASTLRSPSGTRLVERGFHPLGWLEILDHAHELPAQRDPDAAARSDYFALCLAAHFASVASYVPTDVDAKIRHALWFDVEAREELARMSALALYVKDWDVRGVSARLVDAGPHGLISGHDGERLSVLCGGMLAVEHAGDAALAGELASEIDRELAREAQAFTVAARRRGGERHTLELATVLTHNAGDIMQALDAKGARPFSARARQRFGDLARTGFDRYGGAFGRAAALYREMLAQEGHRNYPLREVKALRRDAALLLPLAPYLDDWGRRLAEFQGWTSVERAEVVTALVLGCRRVQGQEGYYRALVGFDAAHRGGLEAKDIAEHFTTAVKREFKDTTLRKKLAVRRESFESSLAKRSRAILDRNA